MRTTIGDIARYCNVSEGTVDRALNNRPGINIDTKNKILNAVKELNYYPNYTGRSLAKGKTMTIGVVCFDLYNNFFPELIDTIEARAKERGYFIYLILTHKDIKLEKDGLQYLFERQVDGIILFPIGIGEEYVDKLRHVGIPIVTLYNKLTYDFSYIGVDDEQAMCDAVEFIAARNYERIIYLTPDIEKQESEGLNTYTLKQRKQGYVKGIKKAGLSDTIVMEGSGLTEKLDTVINNYDLSVKTALLCVCDSYAIKAMHYLRQRGLSIPEHIGLMGYDDIESLKYIYPRLTTIKYSVLRMGQAAIDTLFNCIGNPKFCKEFLLDYRIIDGETI